MFSKQSFIIRNSDLPPFSNTPPFIWSIENHVMIVKWVPTDTPGQFQITNRYDLWNACETDRYTCLDVAEEDIVSARETGIVHVFF